MQRHGYKGAFELSATVDYLFGYDATAGVVEDWMYKDVTRKYVLDEKVRGLYEGSNPWALRAISERLLEAAERGLWSEPDPEDLEALKRAYLETKVCWRRGAGERILSLPLRATWSSRDPLRPVTAPAAAATGSFLPTGASCRQGGPS
jgi:cobalamin biosynthesis Mg chelatase CobN